MSENLVLVSLDDVQALQDRAQATDPGLAKADTWSSNTRTRERYRAIAAHYEAVGVRRTLIELGLWPLTKKNEAAS